MSNLIKYVHLTSPQEKLNPYIQFDLTKLHPLDLVRVMLEQYIFADYLRLTGSETTADDLTATLDINRQLLPNKLPGATTAKSSIYQYGLEQLKTISERRYAEIIPSELFLVFSEPVAYNYQYREYTGSINQDFLSQWLSLTTGYCNKDQFPDGKLYDTAIYVLRPQVELNYDPNVYKEENHNYISTIALEAYPATYFNLAAPRIAYSLSTMIDRFSFKDLSVDQLVGLLAGFSIDHARYDMTSQAQQVPVRMSDVCYDLVTGSSYVPSSAGLAQTREVQEFLDVIRRMCATQRLKGIDESELFGALLQKCGEKPEIVNYFIKPANAITASEAYAFRHSEYSSMFYDKVMAAMEAAEDDTGAETEVSDTGDDTATSQAETTPGDDVQLDANTSKIDQEAKETEEVDHQPEIDPNLMLLELASPKETQSDYLYRETVNRRISHILRNPPENARPNDLLLLKRFKSRWLYLVSISTIRDFLTRFSLRLSGH